MQHARCFGRAGNRVDPVPGLRGDDNVEAPARRIPVFEGGHVDLESAFSRELRHAYIGLDSEYRAAGRSELPCRDAGAAAEIEDPESRAYADDPVYKAFRG